LTAVKRLDLLLEALALLKQQSRCYNVVLIGNGECRDLLERRTDELGIRNNVWFYGASYDEKKNAELLFNADLCVSPGNIGLTAMHSMMFGCPCITNNDFDCQMPEFEAVHEGITGAFFKSGDINSLAEAIDLWFDLHGNDRDVIRKHCFNEVDDRWNLHHQVEIMKKVLLEG
jgi:glycosyltransferase involved in cell wall biosynthesis